MFTPSSTSDDREAYNASALHPGADVGYDRGDPNRAKDRPLERTPGRNVGLASLSRDIRGLGFFHFLNFYPFVNLIRPGY